MSSLSGERAPSRRVAAPAITCRATRCRPRPRLVSPSSWSLRRYPALPGSRATSASSCCSSGAGEHPRPARPPGRLRAHLRRLRRRARGTAPAALPRLRPETAIRRVPRALARQPPRSGDRGRFSRSGGTLSVSATCLARSSVIVGPVRCVLPEGHSGSHEAPLGGILYCWFDERDSLSHEQGLNEQKEPSK